MSGETSQTVSDFRHTKNKPRFTCNDPVPASCPQLGEEHHPVRVGDGPVTAQPSVLKDPNTIQRGKHRKALVSSLIRKSFRKVDMSTVIHFLLHKCVSILSFYTDHQTDGSDKRSIISSILWDFN